MFVTFENLFQSYSVWKKLVNIYWSYITREEPASFWRENVVIAVVLLLRNLAGMS